MRHLLVFAVAAVACTAAAEHAGDHAGPSRGATAAAVVAVAGESTRTNTAAKPESSAAPTIVRALYVNRWASQSKRRMAKLIATADSTEINALVIDMKDEFGLNYRSQNPAFAKNAGTAKKANVAALLDTLRAHKIFPIARLVVFKDSVTARIHPEWTIRRTDGSIWRDKKGIVANILHWMGSIVIAGAP